MAHILIIDDDNDFREALAETLASLRHEVTMASGGRSGLEMLEKSRPDAVFLDHRMPDMDGLEVLRTARERLANLPPIIVLTAYASAPKTIESMRMGAFDHLTKPASREAIREVLDRALAAPVRLSTTAPRISDEPAGELIGISASMREVHKRIGLAAASDVPVLITGETGTGKELVARALHAHSARSDAPFLAVNCAAIPRDLLEAELFGHVRGAFTGANAERLGCFRAADRGVLLLDEIGEMAPAVQAKLLRVIQEGEVTPVGTHRAQKVDVRIVAATHRHLETQAREGRFREDLRFRLDVLSIKVPPLRERLGDIIPLAEHFLRKAAGAGLFKTLSIDAAQCLLSYGWPGNVRELQNVMGRSHVLVRHAVVTANDLELTGAVRPVEILPSEWLDGDLAANLDKLERMMIQRALEVASGNRAEAARRLGIHRQLLYRKIAQHRLD